MRKIIIILIAILISTSIALSILSSNDDYMAERLFYRASKTYNKIEMNPDVAPPAMLVSVKSDLQKIIKEYPKTETAKLTCITLSEIYISDKKYNEAIRILDRAISTYDKDVSLSSRAYFLKGLTYEKQDKWDKALREFTTLKDKYVNTPLGLQMPLYIAAYYIRKGETAKAESEYNNAVMFYEKLEKDNRGTMLGYTSSNFLVEAYMKLKKYEEAGGVVENTIINYSMARTLMQQLPYVELIFVKTLKNPEKAVEIYNYVVGKIEDAKLKEALQERIKVLQSQQ